MFEDLWCQTGAPRPLTSIHSAFLPLPADPSFPRGPSLSVRGRISTGQETRLGDTWTSAGTQVGAFLSLGHQKRWCQRDQDPCTRPSLLE